MSPMNGSVKSKMSFVVMLAIGVSMGTTSCGTDDKKSEPIDTAEVTKITVTQEPGKTIHARAEGITNPKPGVAYDFLWIAIDEYEEPSCASPYATAHANVLNSSGIEIMNPGPAGQKTYFRVCLRAAATGYLSKGITYVHVGK